MNAERQPVGAPVPCPHCGNTVGALTPFRDRFVDELVAGAPSATEAAKRAGAGHAGAHVTAYRALKNATVRAEIERRKLDRLDKAKAIERIAGARVLRYLEEDDHDPWYALKALLAVHKVIEERPEDADVSPLSDRERFASWLRRTLAHALDYGVTNPERASRLADHLRAANSTAQLI